MYAVDVSEKLVWMFISQPEPASSSIVSSASVALADVACALRLLTSSVIESREDSAEYVIVIVVQSPRVSSICKRRRVRPPRAPETRSRARPPCLLARTLTL